MSIGKVNENGTLNDGAFYSIPDVNVLVKNGGSGGSGGGNTVVIPLSTDGNTIQITASELRQYITAGKNIVLELYASSTYGSVTFEMDTRYYFAYYMTNATEGEEPAISEYLFGFMYYDKTDSQFLNREFVATTLSDNPQVGQ